MKYIDILIESLKLEEMPISSISHVGNWEKNSSFRTQDRKLLNNPKAITKIKALWKYPEEVNYNVVLVNDLRYTSERFSGNYTEHGTIGKPEQAKAWISEHLPLVADQVNALIKPDEVNIVYLSNDGAQRVPMTAWIMAHRYGHAIRMGGKSQYYEEATTTLDRYLRNLADAYKIRYGTAQYSRQRVALVSNNTRTLMQAICTFKSAREGTLRNSAEAVHELFAQYILTGTIKFNNIPKSVKVGREYFSYSEDDYDYDNRTIANDLSYELENFFAAAIHYSVGHTFIM